MKKIIFLIIFFSFFLNNSFAYDLKKLNCNQEYLNKLELCRQSIIAWNYKSLDFICIQRPADMQLFQIILDDHFKKIDIKAKRTLNFLDRNKDYYFWNKENSPTFFDWINDIENDFWVYWKYYELYRKACFDEINRDFTACYREYQKKDDISSFTLMNSYNDICFWLAKTKLNIYKKVAFEILLLNKLDLRKDNRTWFMQDLRNSYSALARLFDINIWLIERIYARWPKKIKEAYTQ